MSWSNRITLLLLPLLITDCGFQPLYGKKHGNNAVNASLVGVRVDPIPNGRMGQQLRTELEDRLNPNGVTPEAPIYRLTASISDIINPIDVARDGTISRYNVYIDSSYVLYRIADGKQVTSGKIRHVTSYNNSTNEYFSTYVAEEDAISRGISELSVDYQLRLSSYLSRDAAGQEALTKQNTAPVSPPRAVPALP